MIYRNSAIVGASPIGLMIALFDRLAADLRRAAEAIRKGDIETRCAEINHGFLVLGQLESWLDRENGGESARQLATFYAHLRGKMMQASLSQSASLLEQQIEALIHIRSSWQILEAAPAQPARQSQAAGSAYGEAHIASAVEHVPFSQSA